MSPRPSQKQQAACTLGLDFGTDSVRAVLVDCANGQVYGSQVASYRDWAKGRWCDPARDQFRQHPRDLLQAMTRAVRGAVKEAGARRAAQVIGVAVDATGSTPLAVDANGDALALSDRFADDPAALFILWKDHTALAEAEEIAERNRRWKGADFLRYTGGACSSEWFLPKLLHLLRHHRQVARAMAGWVECSDWLPAVLSATTAPALQQRNRCAAGHKANWHAAWNGLPAQAFLTAVDKRLAGWRSRLYTNTVTAEHCVGGLSKQWAKRFGLPAGIAVAAGAIDAHVGAIGAGARPGTLCKVIGTSTCDMLVARPEDLKGRVVPGIGGQVDGSIVPGALGLEAGQGAFGDIYAWFRNLLAWSLDALPSKQAAGLRDGLLARLGTAAAALPMDERAPLAVDWHNGRRSPDANEQVAGAITGLRLGSDAPRVFRSLVEATAFGSRAILDRFTEHGVEIKRIIALGGIAQKSPFVMQTLADVMGRRLSVSAADEACALGSAMLAAVAAGRHRDVAAAQRAMAAGEAGNYRPRRAWQRYYEQRFLRYQRTGRFLEDSVA